MTTTRFPSGTGLAFGAIYLVIGAVALYAPGWLLVKLGPDSLPIPALVRISAGIAVLVLIGIVVTAVRKGR